jgi:GNAT superfamily N-acetyltransferase
MVNERTELVGQATLIACWRALAQRSRGAHVVRSPSAVAAVFPAWVPLNNAIVDREAEATPELVAEIRALFATAGVPWALWVPNPAGSFGVPDRVRSIPELDRDTTTLVMSAPIRDEWRPNDAVVPTAIETVATFGDEALPLHRLGPAETTPGLSAWAYVHNDQVVSSAYSYVHGTDCGIYAVETVPSSRRRGFAASLLQHVLAGAATQGATTASLQSTPMGQPLYESLGFEPVGRYEEWIPKP